MEIRFSVTKEERKILVKAVGEIMGWAPVYKGAPSFAFAVSNLIIDRDGTLIYDERTDEEDIRRLLEGLSEQGFVNDEAVVAEATEPAAQQPVDSTEQPSADEASIQVDSDRLTVEVPSDGFTDSALDNLERLVSGKSALIMKALGAESLPIERSENTLRFPWFPASASGGDADAYARFIHALCEMAKTQKRVIMKEQSVDSEKFAFRCFLLRLGFIGADSASARRVLLSKLSGSGSFKSGKRKGVDGAGAEPAEDSCASVVTAI